MSDLGALLFARYAYPPNALGYCGPAGADAMLSRDAAEEIERRARRFEGAWAYLQLIAERSGIGDPLDERVVEAYWLGNDLLDNVDSAWLIDRLTQLFRGQPGGSWRQASGRAHPHHSFQVFEVYPWIERLKPDADAPSNQVAVEIVDRCRIRTGRVLEVMGEQALVESRPLVWDGERLLAVEAIEEVAAWSVGGSTLLDGLSAGDTVALHWDWVCDVLTEEQVRRVRTPSSSSDALVSVRRRDLLHLVPTGRPGHDRSFARSPSRTPIPTTAMRDRTPPNPNARMLQGAGRGPGRRRDRSLRAAGSRRRTPRPGAGVRRPAAARVGQPRPGRSVVSCSWSDTLGRLTSAENATARRRGGGVGLSRLVG